MLYQYRKYILWTVVIIVLGTIIWLGFRYLTSFQKVIITFNTTDVGEVKLYKAIEARGITSIDGDSLETIISGKEYTLSKGLYSLQPSGDKIKTDTIKLEVGDQPVQRTLDIDYQPTFLEQQYTTEKTAIFTALNASSNKLLTLYTINPGKLYHHGEWFGTTLSYIGTDSLSRDTLRVIMKKENDTWVVITIPPQITISAIDYPDIPLAVIRGVNAIDLGMPLMPGMQPDPVIEYHI